MTGIVASLGPVFLAILLGVALRRLKLPGDAAWPAIEQLVYFVLFPALLFHQLATADLALAKVGLTGAALLGGILTMAALVALLKRPLGIPGRQYSSVFQGAVRWNGAVALGAIASLGGEAGLAIAAVAFGAMVPVANVMSVYVLTRHAQDRPADARTILRLILRNPLILAVCAGLAWSYTGLGLDPVTDATLDLLADASIALGLLAVGASLDFRAARAGIALVGLASALKLVAMPLIMAGWCLAFGVGGPALIVAVICGAVPSATSAYILAKQLGGDAELMAAIVTVQTALAVLTMPAAIWLLA